MVPFWETSRGRKAVSSGGFQFQTLASRSEVNFFIVGIKLSVSMAYSSKAAAPNSPSQLPVP
jgi:hypothetical protein